MCAAGAESKKPSTAHFAGLVFGAAVISCFGASLGVEHAASVDHIDRYYPAVEKGRSLWGALAGLTSAIAVNAASRGKSGPLAPILAVSASYLVADGHVFGHGLPHSWGESIDGSLPPTWFNSSMIDTLGSSGLSLSDSFNISFMQTTDAAMQSLLQHGYGHDAHVLKDIADYTSARADYIRKTHELGDYGMKHAYDLAAFPEGQESTAEFNKKLAEARASYLRFLQTGLRLNDLQTGRTIYT